MKKILAALITIAALFAASQSKADTKTTDMYLGAGVMTGTVAVCDMNLNPVADAMIKSLVKNGTDAQRDMLYAGAADVLAQYAKFNAVEKLRFCIGSRDKLAGSIE